jgi:hypothetical protein
MMMMMMLMMMMMMIGTLNTEQCSVSEAANGKILVNV